MSTRKAAIARFGLATAAAVACALAVSCRARSPEVVAPTPAGTLEPRGEALEDTAPKEDLRLVPPEVYLRTYMDLFGALALKDAPMEVQRRVRAGDGSALFDTWDDYISALGFPDYRLDRPRQTQTNTIMIAGFERLGVALCDRSLERDWKSKPPVPTQARIVFAFDPPPQGPVDLAAFAPRFDVMHRTFLGYPANLAPTQRTARFYQLYRDVEAAHPKTGKRFTPEEAGWAAVCYGLVRHPEFHLY